MLKAQGRPLSTEQFCRETGLELEGLQGAQSSYLYWCAKHGIPVFCPALTDGSIGDLMYFSRRSIRSSWLI
ncbi:MAG: deoxyhypusine synthase family protein [Nitrosarchaeum sp.]|nr:deoxyhypusine synthase family protein [Nitrosarchaeum sp.]